MGYRSDVKLITTKKGWERLQQAVYEVASDSFIVEDEVATPICEGKYVLAEWGDIKWYDWGDSVISTFEKELRAMSDEIPYEFMRVGEDWEDVEYKTGKDTWKTEYEDMPTLGLLRDIEVQY